MTGQYVVKRGDTLSRIAARVGKQQGVNPTAVQRAIVRANRIADPNRIRAGQVLRLPGQSDTFDTLSTRGAAVPPKAVPGAASALPQAQQTAAQTPTPPLTPSTQVPSDSAAPTVTTQTPVTQTPVTQTPSSANAPTAPRTALMANLSRPGVSREVRMVKDAHGQSHRLTAVTVDLALARASFVLGGSAERGLTTTQFAHRKGAAIAINGDLFESGFRVRGPAVGGDGKPLPGALNWERPYLALTADGGVHIRPEGTPLPQDGSVVGAVSGKRGLLVVDGQPNLNTANKHLERAQQSAIGLTADGRVVFIATRGTEGAEGLNRNELARELVAMGVVQALELDGGGSTSLVLNGRNQLPGGDKGHERPVANHIGLRFEP